MLITLASYIVRTIHVHVHMHVQVCIHMSVWNYTCMYRYTVHVYVYEKCVCVCVCRPASEGARGTGNIQYVCERTEEHSVISLHHTCVGESMEKGRG